jgi:hypothetical protein
MLANSAVIRSASVRAFFLTSAGVTIAVLWWTQNLSFAHTGFALTASFSYLFTVLDQTGASVALLVLIGAVFIARPEWLRPVVLWVSDHIGAITALTAIAFSAGAVFVYQNHPLSMDEYAAYFQSQAFAAGHLAGRFPIALLDSLVPPEFQNFFLSVSHTNGAVASLYWPSFALLLTPFTWLGIPWACNPVISAMTLLAIHRLALQLFEEREAAGFAVLLTIASPVFFADGISYYSMPAHLLANSIYALLLLHPTPRKALLAGLVGSIALTLHNPVPHFLFAVPWFVWIARQATAPRLLLCLCAGYLPLCLLLGIGWYQFTHSLPTAGMRVIAEGPGLVASVSHTIDSVFSLPTPDLLYARLIGLAKIWVWAVPGLMILACAGAWKLRHDARCRLLVASGILTLLGYLMVPVDQGHGWGFRYFHSAWMVLPLLAAGVLARSRAPAASSDRFANENMRAFVTACALLCLVVGVGQRAVQIHQYIADRLDGIPPYRGTERQVMFINANSFYSFYSLDLVQNDPWLRGNVTRMLSRGPTADADLMHDQFPQMRRAYLGPHGSVWINH